MSTVGHMIILAIGFVAGWLFARLPHRPLVVRPREPDLVPLVPAIVRRKHPNQWVN